MKVLVVGSGGREHALCWAIARSPRCQTLYCAPGNAGIAAIARCVDIAADDLARLVDFAAANAIDLVVVGPEAPLAAGLVDRLADAGVRAFGPRAAAAALEGSKGFMKDLCAKYRVPTAEYARFDEPDAAKEYIHAKGAPIVVKADGLASGKGVIVCRTANEAFAAIDHIMTERAFGRAGDEVVIEELLDGEEASFFALVDGRTVLPFGSAQDHKAAFDGDVGPNTGGMGAFSPAPIVTGDIEARIMDRIMIPVIEAMAAEGRPYAGVLYAGLMIKDGEPKVLEFNVRFGDPECQALVLRLGSDLLEALAACAEGRLASVRLEWLPETSLVVVVATKGYPGWHETGGEIRNLEAAAGVDGVAIFHAGTKRRNGRLIASGGRVLGVAARGATVIEAQRRAYRSVDLIDWPQGFCRRDIGWRAIARAEGRSRKG